MQAHVQHVMKSRSMTDKKLISLKNSNWRITKTRPNIHFMDGPERAIGKTVLQ